MSQPVPEWASFFSEERFAIFIERVEFALSEAGVSFALDLEEGSWKALDETGGKVYGLVNLAQICNQLPMDDWDAEIGPFLLQIRKSHSEDEVPADFESVRPLLRVRLFASESVGDTALVLKHVAEGFVSCLAVDLPDKIVTVTPDRAAGFGKSIDVLFQIALQNVIETTVPERSTFHVGGTAEIVSLSGSDYFVASLALALDRVIGPECPYGRFVAVPNRHQALTAAIDGSESLGSLGPLVHAARGMFRDGPGSISPYVYWVQDNRWVRLDVDITDEGVGVEGPDEFIESVLRPLLE